MALYHSAAPQCRVCAAFSCLALIASTTLFTCASPPAWPRARTTLFLYTMPLPACAPHTTSFASLYLFTTLGGGRLPRPASSWTGGLGVAYATTGDWRPAAAILYRRHGAPANSNFKHANGVRQAAAFRLAYDIHRRACLATTSGHGLAERRLTEGGRFTAAASSRSDSSPPDAYFKPYSFLRRLAARAAAARAAYYPRARFCPPSAAPRSTSFLHHSTSPAPRLCRDEHHAFSRTITPRASRNASYLFSRLPLPSAWR